MREEEGRGRADGEQNHESSPVGGECIERERVGGEEK